MARDNATLNGLNLAMLAALVCVWVSSYSDKALAQHRNHDPVIRVQIASLPYTATTIIAMSPGRLLAERSRALYFVDRTDSAICHAIGTIMRGIRIDKGPRRQKHIDARVVCIAFYSHGKPDTLSFGGCFMKRCRRLGYLQPQPLLGVASFLPEDHQRMIIGYLDSVWMPDGRFPKYGYKQGEQ